MAVDSGMAFFVGNPNLYAMDLSAKGLAWQVSGNFNGTPAAANGRVYAISNNLIATYTLNGNYLGSFNADSTIQNQPIVTLDSLIATDGSSTYIYDLFTYKLRQKIPIGGLLSLADGVLYISTSTGVIFSYSSHNDLQLVVSGTPMACDAPQSFGYGTNWLSSGQWITDQVSMVVETNMARYQCVGWTGSGSVPALGATNSVAFKLTNNSTLTWVWNPLAFQLACQIGGAGTVSASNGWYQANQDVTITATPSNGFVFVQWRGDIQKSLETNATITLTMNQGRRIVAVFRAAGQSPLAGNWSMFGNGPSHSGYFPGTLGSTTFTPRWRTTIGGNLQQVAVGSGRVYATPYQCFGAAYLTAVNEYSGQVAWSYNFSSCYSVNPPAYDQGCVYMQRSDNWNDTQLWSFNALNGVTNWTAPFNSQWERYMAPTIADGGIWVDGGTYGGLYGFNESDGSQRFFDSLSQVDGWTPAYYQRTLYTQIGTFRAHDPTNGSVLWSIDESGSSGAGASTTLAIADGKAYFVGSPNLFGVDLASHTLALRINGSFSGYPAAANGYIYAISNSAVNAYSTSGQFIGRYITGDSGLKFQPIITDDALFVASDSTTYIFDLFTFKLKQTIPIGGYISLADGALFVAMSGGDLCSYSSGRDVLLIVSANNLQVGVSDTFSYGSNWVAQGSAITPSVISPTAGSNGVRYVATGWVGSGSTPSAGTSNSVTFVITNDSTIAWQWKTQYLLTASVNSNGNVNISSNWFDSGSTVNLTATPSNYFHFAEWQNGLIGSNASVLVTMSGPLSVKATFQPNMLTNNIPAWWLAQYGIVATDAGALADTDGDGLPNWRECLLGTNPLLADSDGDHYPDGLEAAWGSNPLASNSVPLATIVISGSPSNNAAPKSLGYGTNLVPLYTIVTNTVPDTYAITNGQRSVCLGWIGTGDCAC